MSSSSHVPLGEEALAVGMPVPGVPRMDPYAKALLPTAPTSGT